MGQRLQDDLIASAYEGHTIAWLEAQRMTNRAGHGDLAPPANNTCDYRVFLHMSVVPGESVLARAYMPMGDMPNHSPGVLGVSAVPWEPAQSARCRP